MKNNKLTGILVILLGMFGLIPFFMLNKSKFIIDESNILVVKYFPTILLCNFAIAFIVLGFLLYKGTVVSYYSRSISKYEKAKTNVYGIILSIPTWISASTVIFAMSKSVKWKILWFIFMIFIVWELISGIRVLTKTKDS